MATILVLEDDPSLSESITLALRDALCTALSLRGGAIGVLSSLG